MEAVAGKTTRGIVFILRSLSFATADPLQPFPDCLFLIKLDVKTVFQKKNFKISRAGNIENEKRE